MTDREVLERAVQILTKMGWPDLAEKVYFRATCLRDKPPPDTVPVRIAIAVGDGIAAARVIGDDVSDKTVLGLVEEDIEPCEEIGRCIAIVHVPKVQIPVVTGEVEPMKGTEQ